METDFEQLATIPDLVKRIKEGYGQYFGPVEEEKQICPICKDQRWVVLDVPVDHLAFGKSFPCECAMGQLRQYRWDHCGIPDDHRHETFEVFEQRRASEAFSAAVDFAAGKFKLLVLCGNTGAGKTHLANAIVMNALHNDTKATLIRAMDWLDDLRYAISRDIQTKGCESNEMMAYAVLIPVLAIDELKWRTSFDEDKMDDLVNRRLATEKHTVITSNSTIDEMADTFPRIMSRTKDPRFGRAIWINAPDYRQYLLDKSRPESKASLRVSA